MNNELTTWITNQEMTARDLWHTATRDTLNADASESSLRLSQHQADYWNGYATALANLKNELENMPTKRGKHAR